MMRLPAARQLATTPGPTARAWRGVHHHHRIT